MSNITVPLISQVEDKVGISTTSPASKLTVESLSTSTPDVLRLVSHYDNGAGTTGVHIYTFHDKGTAQDNTDIPFMLSMSARNDASQSVTYGRIQQKITSRSDGSEQGAVSIHTRNSGAFDERLTVKGSNVGIGQPDPTKRLEVEGAFAGTIGSYFDTGSNGYAMYNGGPVLGVSRVSNGTTSLEGPIFDVGRDNNTSTHYNIDQSIFRVSSDEVRFQRDLYHNPSSGSGARFEKIIPRVTPNYPNAGQMGTFQNWYQPIRGESGIIFYGNVNSSGGEYRCAGFIVYSAAENNSVPNAISISVTESVGSHMVDFDATGGHIRVRNTYGYGIELMGHVQGLLR
jgi:hypothetical protein